MVDPSGSRSVLGGIGTTVVVVVSFDGATSDTSTSHRPPFSVPTTTEEDVTPQTAVTSQSILSELMK